MPIPPELPEAILRDMPLRVVCVDKNDLIIACHGHDHSLIGQSLHAFEDPAASEVTRSAFVQVRATGESLSYRARGGRPGLPQRVFDVRVVPLNHDAWPGALLTVSIDVTEEVAAESRRAAQAQLVEWALEATGMGTWTWDLTDRPPEWDDRMKAICGHDEPMSLAEFSERMLHPDDRKNAIVNAERMAREGSFHNALDRIVREGQVRWVLSSGRIVHDETGKPLRMVGSLLDVTDRQIYEQNVARSHKVEAVGHLTAGIAHNFNNMLMTLMPTLQLLEGAVEPQALELLSDAKTVAMRASELVRDLMALVGHPGQTVEDVTDLSRVTHEAVRLCKRTFERSIDLDLAEAVDGCMVRGGQHEISQVIMNLLINARDALVAAEVPSPHIRVVLGQEGDQATLQIQDNGGGVPHSLRDRIFDPFFSTKGGKGTGLGLASSLAIARRLGGELTLDPQETPGASFRLTLRTALADTVPTAAPRAPQGVPSPDELRVLLIEDEALVRRTVRRIFASAGIACEMAPSIADARAVLSGDQRFSTILLDRSLPDGSGTELLPLLRQQQPRARVLYFTGEPVPEAQLGDVEGVLTKPLSREQLLDAVGWTP